MLKKEKKITNEEMVFCYFLHSCFKVWFIKFGRIIFTAQYIICSEKYQSKKYFMLVFEEVLFEYRVIK